MPNIRPTIDLDANNSTHPGSDYATEVGSGGPGTRVADIDIQIGDGDGGDIFAVQVKVNASVAGDLLTISGALPAGITATAYDPATGILRLDGQASFADYEAAIRQVAFSTLEAPGALKRVDVALFDGQDWSAEAAAFIHVVETARTTGAAAPLLDLDANNSNGGGFDYTATYTAGGPGTSIADVDISITDADSTTLASATIKILNWNQPSGDTLSILGALPAGITASAYDPVNLTITLTGTASLAGYQTALRQVVFSSTNPAPGTGDRGIQVTVNDGTLTSNIATTYMHVASAPANVAPALNLDANSSTTGGADYLTTFTAGGAAVVIADTDVLITDSDIGATVASATITLTNRTANDVLIFNGTPPPGITASAYDPATGMLTLSGAASHAAYQTALQQITFNNTGTPSAENRLIDVVVNDGFAASNVAHAIVQIAQGNVNAPVVDLDENNSTAPGTSYRATFTENGSPVAIADTDTLLTDADSTALVSATITLSNREAGDLLSVSGTLPSGITASAYDAGTGILTLSGNASLADYQTALHAIGFSTAGDNPVAGTRTIAVVASDGANNSEAAASLITVAAVNDAPALTVEPNATYQENAAALTLSPAFSVTDPDDTELTLAAVEIADGSFAGDGDVLGVGGSTSGTLNGITFNWNAAQHTLVLSGASSLANYQALLQSVEFLSASDNPTNFNADPTRTLNWTVSDGTTTTTETTTLNIVAANDPPQVTVAASAAYTENGAPLAISPAATVTDVDDVNLIVGDVRIVSGGFAGDILTVNGLQSGTFAGIDFTYNAGLQLLAFTHPTSVADYQAFLQAVEFHSTSDDPTSGGANPTRTLSWSVFDGDAFSTAQQTILSITAVNDFPAIDLDADDSSGATGTGYTTSFTENGAAVPVTDVDVIITDDLTTVMSGALVFFSATGPQQPGDSLSVDGTLPAGISATVAPDGSAVNLSGLATAADYQTALRQIVFSNSGDNPDTTPRVIVVEVSDAEVATAQALATINIIAANDPPVAQGGNASGNEDSPINGTLIATDIDTESLTYRLGAQAAHGIAAVNPDGSFTYTPAPDFNGTDSFTFIANDGAADSNTATVTLTIAAVNDPPVAQDGSAIGSEDMPINGTLAATDIDNATLTYSLGTQAAHGIVAVNADGSFIYTPAQDFSGTDSFTFIANDGVADSNIATVNLTIAAVNDAPQLDLDADDSTVPSTHYQTTFAGTPVAISDIDVAITDPDSETIASATIHLLIRGAGDLLSVSGALPVGISASAYDPATGILTLNGAASLADYQTAIHQVEFATSGTSPASRMIEVKVNDGTLDSNAAVAVIDFSVAPEPPEPPLPTVDPHWMKTQEFTTHPLGWSPIIVGDLAGDDMSDLVWRSDSTGNLDEWQIVDAGWTRSVDLGGHPGSLRPVSAGDFNGDGTDDLFWFDPASGNTDIWTMANGERATSISPGPHPTGFQVAGTGDFDGDGTDDILWFSPQTGEVDIWKIVSGQWAGSVNPGPSPAGFAIAATGDVNQDGSDDVIWFNASSGDVQIWEMQNGQRANTVDVGPHPGGYSIVGAADFSGDGADDILWFDPTTNHVDLWKMQDGQWAGSVDIGLHPPGWQPIGVGDADGNGIADVWWQLGETSKVETWLLSIQ
jgi:VCBS repeat-containing protein